MDRFDWLEMDRTGRGQNAGPLDHAGPPVDAPSYLRAANRMFGSGHFKTAADYYRKAVEYDGRQYDAWVRLIDTLVRGKRLEEAMNLSEEAVERFKRVRILYSARALVLAHAGLHLQAWPFCDVGLEGDKPPWYARHVKAELSLIESPKTPLDAVRLFEDSVAEAEWPWRANLLAGWAYLDRALPVVAAGFLSEAARHNPRAPLVWLCLGDCFKGLRLYEQAAFYYDRAAELEPQNELILERRKTCQPLLAGLMRVFRGEDVRKRLRDEYRRLVDAARPDDEWN